MGCQKALEKNVKTRIRQTEEEIWDSLCIQCRSLQTPMERCFCCQKL